MTTDSGPSAITLTLVIPAGIVDLLMPQATCNFLSDQPDRFLPLGGGELLAADGPKFDDGTLIWTNCVADALLLRAYEEATG